VFQAHWSTDRARMFFHSSSYTANPIACAAANANLAIWREEPVAERIATLSARQAEHLEALSSTGRIANARQLGTVAALDLRVGKAGYMDDLAPRLMAFFRDRDVLLRPLGATVYVMPPYCITSAQLSQVWDAITESATML